MFSIDKSRSILARGGLEIAANKTPPPRALRAAPQAQATRLIGCIRRQNPPLRGVPGAPRLSPPNPQSLALEKDVSGLQL